MISFNCEGMKRNQSYLKNILSNLKPKIIFLQEIWLPYSEHSTLDKLHPEYSFKISTPDMFTQPEDLLGAQGHDWHGVAIGWRREISACVTQLAPTCDRVTGIKLPLKERSILLLSYYAPTAGHDEDFRDSICSLTELLLLHSSPGDQIVHGADSNCSSKSSGRRKIAWEYFCTRFQSTSHLDHPFTIIMVSLSPILTSSQHPPT